MRASLDTSHQATLGNVAVVATATPPLLHLEGFASGKGEVAGRAAGGMFIDCIGGMGHCSGSMCGAALILLLGVCGVVGIVSGIAGAAMTPGADVVAANVAQIDAAARIGEVRQIQQQMRESVEAAAVAAGVVVVRVPENDANDAAAAGDYRPLAYLGADSVVETTLTEVGTEGSGGSAVAVYMLVHVRVLDTVSSQPRYAADYRYQGRRLELAAWAADGGRRLREEIVHGYRRLGEHIHDSVFDLYPFPDRDPHSAGGALSAAFGLAPLSPPTRGTLTGDRLIGSIFEWYAAESAHPRLRWEAFPRASDRLAAPEEMARVRNVTYDLLVAREENMAPAGIIFQREGLVNPEYDVGGLQPGARYFWTVRARFELDGRQRVTEWGATRYAPRAYLTAPSQNSYRFRTPE